MLYLNPPFLIINGVAVFGDHADPLQYYYMPLMPQLTTVKDPVTEVDMPQIQFIRYRGRAGNGGFLNFDVNLGLPDEDREQMVIKIRQDMNLPDKPRLAPIPIEDGNVRLLLLGKATDFAPPPPPDGTLPASGGTPPPTPPAADDGQPRFVIKMDHPAKPSLYGDNQATFSVQLDQDGVSVLEKALLGQMSPIGIVYSLTFLALRPAYSVRLTIDWDRVQKHMDESFGVNIMFSSYEIDKVVDELIESRAIVIESDTFITEDQDKGIINRRDQALDEVRDMITDNFFTSSINPIDTGKDGLDRATDAVQKVSNMLVTGGAAGFASFSYKKIDMTRIDHKKLNSNISERTTVRKNIYPQGHLSGLFRVLRNPGVNVEDFIVSVDLDNPWFERRHINVISRGNFDDDNISSINVMLQYNNQPRNIILESSVDRKVLEWNSAFGADGNLIMKAIYTYRVTFKNFDGGERPLFLDSPELTIETENLEIYPRELYTIKSIPVLALNFPWDHYSAVEIDLNYSDPVNHIEIEDSFLLTKEKPGTVWKLFMMDSNLDAFRYKIIYRSVDSKDVEMSWVTSDEENITIRDPFPQKRTLLIVPNIEWTKVDSLFVDVLYEDPENDISESGSFDFRETSSNPKQFTVDLQNKNRQLVQFDVTILFKDGSLTRIPTSYTLDKRIIIRSDMKGHRIINIHTDDNLFEPKNLREIKVEIKYEDAMHGLTYEDAFSLENNSDQKNFEYDYVDASYATYDYKVSYLYNNGLSRSGDWQKEKLPEIRIPVK